MLTRAQILVARQMWLNAPALDQAQVLGVRRTGCPASRLRLAQHNKLKITSKGRWYHGDCHNLMNKHDRSNCQVTQIPNCTNCKANWHSTGRLRLTISDFQSAVRGAMLSHLTLPFSETLPQALGKVLDLLLLQTWAAELTEPHVIARGPLAAELDQDSMNHWTTTAGALHSSQEHQCRHSKLQDVALDLVRKLRTPACT